MKRFLAMSLFVAMLLIAQQTSAQVDCASNITTTTVTSVPSSHTFGVILVQFSDWASNDNARGGRCIQHLQYDHYKWQEFRRAFFTQDSYITNPNGVRTHDLEDVFGSLRDYFNEISYNKYDVVKHPTKREILNDSTAAGIPKWITLHQTKSWWDTYPNLFPKTLLDSAYVAAQKAGMPIDTVGYNKLAVVYAGQPTTNSLRPRAHTRVYFMNEKILNPRGRTQTIGAFDGIGTNCHEYSHLIGTRDLYNLSDTDHPRGLSEFSLMSTGNQGFMNGDITNSTLGGFHAPVHLDAWHKLCFGWAKYKELPNGSYTFKSFEAEDTIAVYFIDDTNPTNWSDGEYYLFQNVRPAFSGGQRTFDGDIQFGAIKGGLLISHFAQSWNFTNSLDLEVKEADGSDAVGTYAGVASMGHIFPGTGNNTTFHATSTPPSNDIFGTPSGLSLTNITNNNGVVSATVGSQLLLSNSALATAGNGARKIVRDSYGVYHVAFESAGHIYYRKSTDGGSTWTMPRRISLDTQGDCRYPSIAERKRTDAANQPTELFVVWQRKYTAPPPGNDKNWVQYTRSNDGGSTWTGAIAMASDISPSIDPIPVIATNLPGTGANLEFMLVYRHDVGLKFTRWANGTFPQIRRPVTGTTSSSRNPSLVYKANDYGYFNVAWDDGSNIKHQIYYGGTTWGSATTVSNGTSAYNHQYSPYALSANNDRHIVWQAFEAVTYQKQAIYHNKTLTNVFTVFASTNWDHLKPSGTGHTNGTFTALCYDSNNNIRKRYYNGSYWQGGAEGTVIASNSLDASVSIANPPGAVAKAVWRSSGSAPYTLTVGPSGGLSKNAADESWAYHRRVVFSLNDSTALALQMGTVQLLSAGGKTDQTFSVISDEDSIKINDLAAALKLSNFLLPTDADSLAFEVKVYGQDAGDLRNDPSKSLDLAFDLLSAATGQPLASVKLGPLNNTGTTRQSARLVFPVQALRGRQVDLAPAVSNLDLAKVNGALVHVYEVVEDGAQKAEGEVSSLVAASQPTSFSVRVYPNPFNPSTQICFYLPSDGIVAVRVYDVNGRVVKDFFTGFRIAGEHSVTWDGRDELGRNVASGMYFSEVSFGEQRKIAKMMLVR